MRCCGRACLYTPLALYAAFRLRPVPEYAVRLAGFGAFIALWNAVLHVPLLAASLYAVVARY